MRRKQTVLTISSPFLQAKIEIKRSKRFSAEGKDPLVRKAQTHKLTVWKQQESTIAPCGEAGVEGSFYLNNVPFK